MRKKTTTKRPRKVKKVGDLPAAEKSGKVKGGIIIVNSQPCPLTSTQLDTSLSDFSQNLR